MDTSDIRARIEGKRVVSLAGSGDQLLLDDGTVLRLYMSDSDCCAYAHGEWVVQPESLDAIITDVQYELIDDRKDNGDGSTSHAKITILHNQNPLALGDCYADDGNGGYYFSALSLSIRVPEAEDFNIKVVEA